MEGSYLERESSVDNCCQNPSLKVTLCPDFFAPPPLYSRWWSKCKETRSLLPGRTRRRKKKDPDIPDGHENQVVAAVEWFPVKKRNGWWRNLLVFGREVLRRASNRSNWGKYSRRWLITRWRRDWWRSMWVNSASVESAAQQRQRRQTGTHTKISPSIPLSRPSIRKQRRSTERQ